MVILGGGPVGVEMAQAVSRLGGEVEIVEMRSPAPREPAALGQALGEALADDGVGCCLGEGVRGAP